MTRSISELIKAGGGPEEIAAATAPTEHPIGFEAVQKWRRKGIPHWHWPVVMRLTGASEREIFAANQALLAKPQRGGGSRGGSQRKTRTKRRVMAEAMA